MSAIYLILLTISLFAYIFLEGKREGLYYYYKMLSNETELNRGEHTLFTIQRVIVLIEYIIVYFVVVDYNILDSALLFTALCFIFPFIHDNSYYFERHRLDSSVYSFRLNNMSTTSVAMVDKKKIFTVWVRNILFIIGVGIFIYEIINKI